MGKRKENERNLLRHGTGAAGLGLPVSGPSSSTLTSAIAAAVPCALACFRETKGYVLKVKVGRVPLAPGAFAG